MRQEQTLECDREEWNTPNVEATTKPSAGFAFLYVPRLRDSVWELLISQGIDSTQLETGTGHYPKSAPPGESGNFAVAGHRSGNGEPFADFDRSQQGDRIVIETKDKWFVYVLDQDIEVKPCPGFAEPMMRRGQDSEGRGAQHELLEWFHSLKIRNERAKIPQRVGHVVSASTATVLLLVVRVVCDDVGRRSHGEAKFRT